MNHEQISPAIVKKRVVKAPKIYLRDSGLLHSLLQIETLVSLQSNPRYGASWEGIRYGFEFKVTEKPSVTHSMNIAKEDLGLDKVYLVYPGGYDSR